MRLEIDEAERALLLGLLDEQLGDVRDGIYRAERHDFKDQLKAKKDVITGLMGRLRRDAPVPAGTAEGP